MIKVASEYSLLFFRKVIFDVFQTILYKTQGPQQKFWSALVSYLNLIFSKQLYVFFNQIGISWKLIVCQKGSDFGFTYSSERRPRCVVYFLESKRVQKMPFGVPILHALHVIIDKPDDVNTMESKTL